MKFSRYWAMPSADTFDCEPIAGFVQKYLLKSRCSIDPFARNKRWATYTNDLNPETLAEYHLPAEEFLTQLHHNRISADLLLFDPPYSPRQISECYQQIGKKCSMQQTQNGSLYKTVREAAMSVLSPDAIVLSFGWNSSGMGIKRGFELIEILIVCHGGGHNDTICIAERRLHHETVPELFPVTPPQRTEPA